MLWILNILLLVDDTKNASELNSIERLLLLRCGIRSRGRVKLKYYNIINSYNTILYNITNY